MSSFIFSGYKTVHVIIWVRFISVILLVWFCCFVCLWHPDLMNVIRWQSDQVVASCFWVHLYWLPISSDQRLVCFGWISMLPPGSSWLASFIFSGYKLIMLLFESRLLVSSAVFCASCITPYPHFQMSIWSCGCPSYAGSGYACFGLGSNFAILVLPNFIHVDIDRWQGDHVVFAQMHYHY